MSPCTRTRPSESDDDGRLVALAMAMRASFTPIFQFGDFSDPIFRRFELRSGI